MSESQKTYSRRQLISVAEVANAFALSRDIAGLEAIQQLAECVLQGKLCADLYPPHQYWQHGGQSDLIGKPAQNSVQVWRSLAAKSVERHMSDKDDFSYPPSASTYHLLADDVFAFARTGGLSARAAEAMRDLSVRHKAELATPTAIEPQTQLAPSHQAAASARVVAESASNDPDAQEMPMKKRALIAALEHEWKSIKADLSDATRNGLKDAAHTGRHGEWYLSKARTWAVSKGKIRQAASVLHPAIWPGTVTRNRP